MMEPQISPQRNISGSQFRDYATINQGDAHTHYHLPHQPARAAVHAIPYPRNEDLVHRPDLVAKLNQLLPQTTESCSAALWGLGGSGKTQIALDYAYRRCDDRGCSVFWVHADSEATFSQDYKTIARKLGVDKALKDEDLFAAVREYIELQPQWVLILDNADDLALFGVGRAEETTNLFEYIPRAPTGTILWTSRDEHIIGTLVGSRRGVRVGRMAPDEAIELLNMARNVGKSEDVGGTAALLEELQWLPLAISQAGGYMRRTSTSVNEYLSMLVKGKQRWELLQETEVDRHRKPNVSNSVLETWAISIDRIRRESEMAYRILHVMACMDNRNIAFEMVAAASKYMYKGVGKGLEESEVRRTIMRLKEFSFISEEKTGGGKRSYDMHKLVQEATRYGFSRETSGRMEMQKTYGDSSKEGEGEGYFSGIAVQVVDEVFPASKRETWWECEKYMAHAVQVGEWAELCGKEIEIAGLLERVSGFLYERGRWREREPVNERALNLRRSVLGEKHPDTISSRASLATTYHMQGRYGEAESTYIEVLDLRRETLGKKHPDTISSMADLATTYHMQGRYGEAEPAYIEVLDLRRETLGEKHPNTISSMASLAVTYHEQGRYGEAEPIKVEVLDLRRVTLGEKHPDTIWSMAELAATYHKQGRYGEAESAYIKVLDLRRETLGKKHPDTIRSMADLAATYHMQGRYGKAEPIKVEVLGLRRETLGEKHPDTIWSMASLATTCHQQDRYGEAESIKVEVLDLRRETLGEKHPDTIRSMASLATTYHAQGRYGEAEPIDIKVLDLRRETLGEKHPDTLHAMHDLAITWKSLARQHDAFSLMQQCLQWTTLALGSDHPMTKTTARFLTTWMERESD